MLVDTRERILEASLKLFIMKGFTDVSMNELLNAVKITKGGFYHYFESKDQLLDEVIKKYVFSFLDKLVNTGSETGISLEEKIKTILYSIIEYDKLLKKEMNDPDINFRAFYLLLMEGVKKFPNLAVYYTDFQKQIVRKIENVLEQGKKEGIISEGINTSEAALYIFSCQEGMLMLSIINPDYEVEQLIESNLKFIMSSLLRN